MKLIKLSIALLCSAALFSGCDDIADIFNNGINVNLDKTGELTPTNGLVKLSDSESIGEGADGTLYLQAAALKKHEVGLGDAGKELSIKPECDMYPNDVDNPKLALSVENPSPSSVQAKAKVGVDGNEFDEITVIAAAKNSGMSVLSKDNMTPGLVKALSKKPNEILIKGLNLATRADSYTINSWLEIPFAYKKGDVITISRTFAELGLTGVNVASLGKEFQIECEVTSTLPFTINSHAEGVEKIKANLDTPIKPGAPNNPVNTNAVITVVSEEAIDVISDAVIHLQLTAEEGAKLTKASKLTIHYSNLKIK